MNIQSKICRFVCLSFHDNFLSGSQDTLEDRHFSCWLYGRNFWPQQVEMRLLWKLVILLPLISSCAGKVFYYYEFWLINILALYFYPEVRQFSQCAIQILFDLLSSKVLRILQGKFNLLKWVRYYFLSIS